MESVISAMIQIPRGTELLVTIEFNMDMEFLYIYKHDKAIAAVMKSEVMGDTTEHFLPRKLLWTRDGQMWIMIRRVQEVISRTDCILGVD